LNPGLRFDAEFFNRQSLQSIGQIRSRPHERLGHICARIQHPIEVKRDYEDEGLLTIMAKNVRPNRTDLSDLRFMPVSLRPIVSRNKLKSGDVLVTRTGANFGQVAPWRHGIEAFACADILVLRQPSVPSGYLSSFLESAKGKPLVLRGGYGAAQPHIAPPYLSDMLVPRLGDVENRVDRLVSLSVQKERDALETINRAQDTLLVALGLADWTPPEPLSYTARAKNAYAAGRLDAQYFMPAKEQVRQSLAALPGRMLADRVDSIRDMFVPDRVSPTKLVRNYDVTDALIPLLDAEKEPQEAAELGSVKKIFKDGDVAISRLRAYLREIAVVRKGDDIPSVGSSEFIVLRPQIGQKDISPETLMVFLRSVPAQTILKWCQDGSQHPRFSEGDLLAIPVPDVVASVSDQITTIVRQGFAARHKARQLLETAKRAVEIAIEDGEPAALAFLDAVEEAS
jgi:hypothetical protein